MHNMNETEVVKRFYDNSNSPFYMKPALISPTLITYLYNTYT